MWLAWENVLGSGGDGPSQTVIHLWPVIGTFKLKIHWAEVQLCL
jgi:hypothetical protein